MFTLPRVSGSRHRGGGGFLLHGCSMLLPLSTSVSPEIGTSSVRASALPHILLLMKRWQGAPTPPGLQLQRRLFEAWQSRKPRGRRGRLCHDSRLFFFPLRPRSRGEEDEAQSQRRKANSGWLRRWFSPSSGSTGWRDAVRWRDRSVW